MTTQHTPGPWRMHDVERFTVVAGRPGICVALTDADSRTSEVNNANARLIVAAPKLLEACSEAYSTLIDVLNRLEQLRVRGIYHEQAFTDSIGRAAEQLRETELEAEGRQP